MSCDRGRLSRETGWSRWRSDQRFRYRVVGGVVVLLLVGAVVLSVYLRATRRFDARELARRYGREAGLDPSLVLAIIEAESGGRPYARSRSGALGLMQLMPRTAREVAEQHGIDYDDPDDLFDPALNVRLGTLYLARLRRQFDDDPWLYLAAYNAGPGNADKWRLQHPGLPSRELIAEVAFPETRAYVRKVMALWRE